MEVRGPTTFPHSSSPLEEAKKEGGLTSTVPMSTQDDGHGSHLSQPLPSQAVAAKGPDKGKRDEWSEAGILFLLEVYEAKWLVRNHAKLKGSDWEDIAHQVSSQTLGGIKAIKTPNQCKNKIESMKKRYRAEAAVCIPPSSCSSWQFYARMDRLLKGAPNWSNQANADNNSNLLEGAKAESDMKVDEQVQISNRNDGSNTVSMDFNADIDKNNEEMQQTRGTDSELSAEKPSKRRVVAEGIQLIAHSILKIEEARMEMYNNLERLRAEADIKRSEMELKRTKIVADTQLQIAKLFTMTSQGERG